jgi:hypothetical protein
MYFFRTPLLATALLSLMLSTAHAGVIIGGTRIIFDGAKKETSLSVNNPDGTPYLIQSWIDVQEGASGKVPFIITPPLYRLDGGQKNVERIVMTGALPQDRESLFWLNIKAIPSASTQMNALQIAVKTRIIGPLSCTRPRLTNRPVNYAGAEPGMNFRLITRPRMSSILMKSHLGVKKSMTCRMSYPVAQSVSRYRRGPAAVY